MEEAVLREFLRELKEITSLDATHHDFPDGAGHGFSGMLKFQEDVQPLLDRYPGITKRQLRVGSLMVLKDCMRQEREKWYANKVYHTGKGETNGIDHDLR